MIEIIGTSHVSPQSIEEVKNTITKLKPDLIAIELDKMRYEALVKRQVKSKFSFSLIRQLGLSGFIFYLVGNYVENYIAKKTGTIPGQEMLTAVIEAKKLGAKVAVIDQPIQITLRNISRIKLSQKFKIGFDMFFSIFNPRHELRKISLSLSNFYEVPDQVTISKIIDIFGKRYPSFYRVLIDDRNKYMVNKLKLLKDDFDTIVVVVGAGHVNGMKELLKS